MSTPARRRNCRGRANHRRTCERRASIVTHAVPAATKLLMGHCTDSAPARNTTLVGIGLMLAGVSLFAINDALGKWLVATYSVGELLMIRSATALILLMPLIWRAG